MKMTRTEKFKDLRDEIERENEDAKKEFNTFFGMDADKCLNELFDETFFDKEEGNSEDDYLWR